MEIIRNAPSIYSCRTYTLEKGKKVVLLVQRIAKVVFATFLVFVSCGLLLKVRSVRTLFSPLPSQKRKELSPLLIKGNTKTPALEKEGSQEVSAENRKSDVAPKLEGVSPLQGRVRHLIAFFKSPENTFQPKEKIDEREVEALAGKVVQVLEKLNPWEISRDESLIRLFGEVEGQRLELESGSQVYAIREVKPFGKGTYNDVFSGYCLGDVEQVVFRLLKEPQENLVDWEKESILHQEIQKQIPYVVQLQGTFLQKEGEAKNRSIGMILEKCDRDLCGEKGKGADTSLPREKIAEQLLSFLTSLHEKGLLYRDLKPANVLLKKGKVKVGDFGQLRPFDKRTSKGTPLYQPAEAYLAKDLLPQEFVPSVDCFALGVVMYEMKWGDLEAFRKFVIKQVRPLTRVMGDLKPLGKWEEFKNAALEGFPEDEEIGSLSVEKIFKRYEVSKTLAEYGVLEQLKERAQKGDQMALKALLGKGKEILPEAVLGEDSSAEKIWGEIEKEINVTKTKEVLKKLYHLKDGALKEEKTFIDWKSSYPILYEELSKKGEVSLLSFYNALIEKVLIPNQMLALNEVFLSLQGSEDPYDRATASLLHPDYRKRARASQALAILLKRE